MKIKNKILCFALTLSIVANVGLIYKYCCSTDDCNRHINSMSNVYEHNLAALSARCYDIENSLSKLSVCNQPEQSVRLLTELVNDSGAAVTSLSVLPLYPEHTQLLNRYLNHVSDYSKYMLYMSSEGKIPCEECGDNISALKDSVSSINNALTELRSKLKTSPMEWSLLMGNELSEIDMLDNSLFGAIEQIQTEGIEYPTLIYDGPFSDSVVNKKVNEPSEKAITETEAISILTNFIGSPREFSIVEATKCNGIISTWCIALEKGGRLYYGNVAEKTGKVVSFICNGMVNSPRLSRSNAIDVASNFLSSRGYDNMVPQYCEESDGNATVNFVYSENGVLIYPDMVKVRVNMLDGSINGFEGMAYYSNHGKERSTSCEGCATIEEIQRLLPSQLGVTQSNVAIIPTEGENEILCYEYRCKSGNDVYVIYFDVNTKKQVKIFKILCTENGDFVV